MTEAQVLTLAQNTLMAILMLAGPLLLADLVIGLVVSVFQAVTSISEATLSFVPKAVGTAVVVITLGPWMGANISRFTVQVFNSLPGLVR